MTREGDSYGEVITPKGGKGGPRHIGKEMPTQNGDIWQGELALGREASREVLVCNSELRTVDRPIKLFPSGRCPVIFFSAELGGMMGVEVAKHHLISTVHQKGVKVCCVILGRRTPGGYTR